MVSRKWIVLKVVRLHWSVRDQRQEVWRELPHGVKKQFCENIRVSIGVMGSTCITVAARGDW